MATTSSTPAHLEPSVLGTKEYWDKLYEKELSNHADNPRDEGTVWFDDSDAEAKIAGFLDEREQREQELQGEEEPERRGWRLDRSTASVLDLGCGNGSLLFTLRDEGWTGRLLGVDYSERSVELAKAVGRERRRRRRLGLGSDGEGEEGEGEDAGGAEGAAGPTREEKQQEEEINGKQDQDDEQEEADDEEAKVSFQVWDVLRGSISDLNPNSSPEFPGWDLVLDKGTFDAVSLSDEIDPATGRRVFEGYAGRVLALLREGGLFVVTSCNWTEAELKVWFEESTSSSTPRLRLAGRVEYPSFSFGGVKGQTISTLCFEKIGGK
ncbi:hypothetical protein VTJ49DRAFT_2493 [Mycothermus thermophilus]|uniref:Protein-lysine N-methyltransferase EFM4 n=1 Tax=Humicola insolens TaxID=85995 RepID=A0ABR3VA74_HUMIN